MFLRSMWPLWASAEQKSRSSSSERRGLRAVWRAFAGDPLAEISLATFVHDVAPARESAVSTTRACRQSRARGRRVHLLRAADVTRAALEGLAAGRLAEAAEEARPPARARRPVAAQPLVLASVASRACGGSFPHVKVGAVPGEVGVVGDEGDVAAVAAGAAELLVVVLDRLGRAVVEHLPDVGLVDPHPEGDRRDDDRRAPREEGHVRGLALGRRQRPVVELNGDAGAALGEVLAHGVADRLRRRVHDRRRVARLGRAEARDEVREVGLEAAAQLRRQRRLRLSRYALCVSTRGERRLSERWMSCCTLGTAVAVSAMIGTSSGRLAQHAQLAVLRESRGLALGDAVGLVDGEREEEALGVEVDEALDQIRHHQLLG